MTTRLLRPFVITAAATFALVASAGHTLAQSGAPSREPVKGCKWERASDRTAGFAAWVQRCDFGHRKVHFLMKGNALMVQFSDAGAKPEAVIESFELQANESADAGIRRIFLAHVDKTAGTRCVIAPYKPGNAPAGATRFTFVPNAAYEKELKAKQNPNEVPEPPCGDYGRDPDGRRYFQAWITGNVRRVLFVNIGQDDPLFDEMTLQLLAPATSRKN
ncbi:MAG: hypothetical protein ACO1Q7_16660 [Gemmatimonas sp.]